MKLRSVFCIVLFVSVVGIAQDGWTESLLTAAEVRELFSDATMTVTNGRPDSKKGGRDEPFQAYTSAMGIAKTVFDDDSSQTRAWNVSEDGRLCFSRSLSRRKQGTTCGFIVQEGSEYLLYNSKDVKVKSGRVVGTSKKDLLVIFSDFQSGNQL